MQSVGRKVGCWAPIWEGIVLKPLMLRDDPVEDERGLINIRTDSFMAGYTLSPLDLLLYSEQHKRMCYECTLTAWLMLAGWTNHRIHLITKRAIITFDRGTTALARVGAI